MGLPVCLPDVVAPLDFSMEFSSRDFSRCASLITAELGIKMPDSKLSMLQSRLARLARERHFASVRGYLDHLFANLHTAETTHFLDSVTTNKTDFFREPEHFEYLKRDILPSLPHATIWSAACSSGPEPYTLAMVLSEYALARPSFSFRILATDVCTKMLELGRKGIYDEPLIEPVPDEMRRRYLLRDKQHPSGRVRVVPTLRQAVSFHQLNLMDETYDIREQFDVIFLRNVLIYFEPATQQAVVRKLCRNLAPDGFLITGLSEPLGNLDVPLYQVGPSVFRHERRRGAP
jgi:chemotaxis protein methyltransferase CheR